MKKVVILIIIAAVIIAIIIIAGVVFGPILKPRIEPEGQKQEEQFFSIIERGEVSFGQGYNYKVDSAEFIIYAPDLENYDFGYFEAYNNGELIYSSAPLYAIIDLLAFETKDGKYIIVSDYSGGAHCCFKEYVFFLRQGELNLAKELFLGNASISEDSLMLKNNKVYIKAFDDRFAYFYTPFVNSYFTSQYLKVDNGEIEIDNSDFKQDYLEEAVRCENEIEQMLSDDFLEFESYSPMLVCVATNHMLAGQEDIALQKIQEYFAKIPLEHYGQQIDFDAYIKDLIEIYQTEPLLKN